MLEFGSVADRSADGRVDFLQAAYVERVCRIVGLPQEAADAVSLCAVRIRGNPEQSALARDVHRQLFIDRLEPGVANERLLGSGPNAAMLAAVVYMGALPQLLGQYEERGIPERVLVDTLGDMAVWMAHHRKYKGEWGLGNVGWLYRHWSGKLFRLGRLQYAYMAYDKPFKAFRRRSDGQVVALSEAGVRYRGDGRMDGTNGVYDPEGGWTSSYEEGGGVYRGCPVGEDGAVRREPVALSESEWEPVLEKGDTVLDIHIPEGGKMSHELCRDSYGQAVAFAEKHFPDKPFQAFVCTSWLLAPQFRQLLPAESNIVRFRNDYALTPFPADESQTLERVFGFGTKLDDLPKVAKETSLQRIVHDYLAAGGRIHGSGGFILKADWDRGTRYADIGTIGT